ncbi:urokinase plasminogen activator surface receptor-like [Clarias gariepinus]|uniref:urokinase plasminogen activator surface receptor-like n=1 Tax=Clarias gariepinus TaxID=13013 RepID=UPI00234CED5E|nr:urokinase plasminogen activator surface receptor-like [Clarias gariepinus]
MRFTVKDDSLPNNLLCSLDGVVLRNRDRTCFEEACYNISFNAGVVKIASNRICCDFDLCNNEPFPDVDMRPNGKQCHFCAGENCLGIVYCEGIENLCFTYIDATDGTELNVKGCASESACIVPTKGLDFTGMNTDRNISIKCCEGNLCNSAKSVTLSFILMLPLLLSTLLFH